MRGDLSAMAKPDQELNERKDETADPDFRRVVDHFLKSPPKPHKAAKAKRKKPRPVKNAPK